MVEESTGSVETTEAPVETPAVDTGSSADWRSGIDQEIAGDPSLADIKDLNGLAKSYINAQKMVGADKVVLPGPDASPDEMSEFYTRLGRPESYEFDKVELPEGFEHSEPMDQAMKTLMHETGLTNAQANKLYSGYLQYLGNEYKEAVSGNEQVRSEWQVQLKKDLGKAFDESVDLSQRAAKELGGDELLKWFDETGQGDNPMFVKLFAKVGKMMSEAGAEPGEVKSFEMTPESAQQEIARLQRDPNFMNQYTDKEQQGHAEAIKKMEYLFGYAYPDNEEAV
tara:strand:+ start:1409 stop:2254 length:846 start_codon:yes stop_codon:yes gene_type:complete